MSLQKTSQLHISMYNGNTLRCVHATLKEKLQNSFDNNLKMYYFRP